MAKNNTTTFVTMGPNKGGFSFTGYIGEDGNEKFLVRGRDNFGNIIPVRINFQAGQRRVVFHNDKTDSEGNNYVDFIKGSPLIEGNCQRPYFKELNPEKAARTELEEESIRFKAKSIAMNSEGDTLAQLASLAGCFEDNEVLQRQRLVQFANNNPSRLIELAESPDIDIRGDVRKLVDSGIVKRKGFMHQWIVEGQKPIHLGNSEDHVVGKLMDDKKLYGAIMEHYENLK